jgi:uncharacterized membrane protein
VKTIVALLKAVLIGGFFVVLPLVLLYLVLAESLNIVVLLATPIADLFPPDTFKAVKHPTLWGGLLLLGASLLAGVGLQLPAARRAARWVETRLLSRLPAYSLIKSITSQFSQAVDGGRFHPGVMTLGDGLRMLVLVVEDRGGAFVTVMVPTSPAPTAGAVLIVPRERITPVDAGIGETVRVMGQWGVGALELVARATDAAKAASAPA